MENIDNPANNDEYLEYFMLVTEAITRYGLTEDQELGKLISKTEIKDIYLKSFLKRCTPNQAAVLVQLYLDRVYD